MISHLKQSMDQFAQDVDEDYDAEYGVARPMLSAFHRSDLSLFCLLTNIMSPQWHNVIHNIIQILTGAEGNIEK